MTLVKSLYNLDQKNFVKSCCWSNKNWIGEGVGKLLAMCDWSVRHKLNKFGWSIVHTQWLLPSSQHYATNHPGGEYEQHARGSQRGQYLYRHHPLWVLQVIFNSIESDCFSYSVNLIFDQKKFLNIFQLYFFFSIFGHQNPGSGSGFTWNAGSRSISGSTTQLASTGTQALMLQLKLSSDNCCIFLQWIYLPELWFLLDVWVSIKTKAFCCCSNAHHFKAFFYMFLNS
jgi:hypothetical protein